LDGVTDGAVEHEHSVEGLERRRWRGRDGGAPSVAPAGADRWTGGTHVHDVVVEVPESATSDAADPLPPWRALHYLMKR
jgi:hypothetical protein